MMSVILECARQLEYHTIVSGIVGGNDASVEAAREVRFYIGREVSRGGI
ncbi:hypothetical protein [Brevibacillus antibioticus]|nr:hypothetical protein [Brevibacillus antibioticus]